jgi:hypothetical protein
LTPLQLQQLQEGVWHSINTGFRTSWEEQALDLYERHCGWELQEWNSKVWEWPFGKVETTTREGTLQPTVQSLQQPAYYVAASYYSRLTLVGVLIISRAHLSKPPDESPNNKRRQPSQMSLTS